MSDSSPMVELRRIRDELMRRSRFLITSHARPDGDSIGSQVAMAAALRALGKSVRMINRDAPPPAYLAFPGVSAKATGLPRSSAKAWILLVLPPRERPIASSNSPFLSRSPSDAL